MSFILLEIAGHAAAPRRCDRPGFVRSSGKLTEGASEMSDRYRALPIATFGWRRPFGRDHRCDPGREPGYLASATPLTRSSHHAGDDFRKLRERRRELDAKAGEGFA